MMCYACLMEYDVRGERAKGFLSSTASVMGQRHEDRLARRLLASNLLTHSRTLKNKRAKSEAKVSNKRTKKENFSIHVSFRRRKKMFHMHARTDIEHSNTRARRGKRKTVDLIFALSLACAFGNILLRISDEICFLSAQKKARGEGRSWYWSVRSLGVWGWFCHLAMADSMVMVKVVLNNNLLRQRLNLCAFFEENDWICYFPLGKAQKSNFSQLKHGSHQLTFQLAWTIPSRISDESQVDFGSIKAWTLKNQSSDKSSST